MLAGPVLEEVNGLAGAKKSTASFGLKELEESEQSGEDEV